MDSKYQSYFLTYGRGSFKFMLNELKSVFGIKLQLENETENSEGKFIFKLIATESDYYKILSLKTVERVFICLLFRKVNQLNENQISELISDSIKCSNLTSNQIFQIKLDTKCKKNIENENLKRITSEIKYRINCKLRGKWRKQKSFSKCIDSIVQKDLEQLNGRFQYSADQPDFEVICHLNDEYLAVGIPLHDKPLSKRSYLRHPALRSTTCAIMLQLADIKPNETTFILDPFCGASTILAEYLGSGRNANLVYISSDCDMNQLALANENLEHFPLNNNLICANLKDKSILPYRDNVFDIIISDLPFGQSHLISAAYQHRLNDYFELIIGEFSRLLDSNIGQCIVLINKTHLGIFETICLNSSYSFKIVSMNSLSLGETNAFLIKMSKISNI